MTEIKRRGDAAEHELFVCFFLTVAAGFISNVNHVACSSLFAGSPLQSTEIRPRLRIWSGTHRAQRDPNSSRTMMHLCTCVSSRLNQRHELPAGKQAAPGPAH